MKDIALRNFVGGFLGGMLGILMFGLFHWYGLPFGCIFGVMAGWYHRELRLKFIGSKVSSKIFGNPGDPVGRLARFSRFWRNTDTAYCHWTMNEEAGHRTFFLLSRIAAVFLWLSPWIVIAVFLNNCENTRGGWLKIGLVSLMLAELLSVVVSFAVVIQCCDDTNHLGDKFRWESQGAKLYNKDGPILFWAKSTLCATVIWFMSFVFLMVFIAIALVAVVGFLLYSIPWMACAMFRVAGHWPCLVITLATASLSAWALHAYAGTVSILWCIALITGMVSGFAASLINLRFQYSGFRDSPKSFFEKIVGGRLIDVLIDRPTNWVDAGLNCLFGLQPS